MNGASPSRRAAFEVVLRVFRDGAYADLAFGAAADRHGLDPRQRAQAQELAYGAVRRRGTADELVGRIGGRDAAGLDPPLAAALRLGVAELLFSRRTPDRAAVSEAVELAKSAGARRGAGLVNAILRRIAAEREAVEGLLADRSSPESAAVALSYPLWLARRWFWELGPAQAVDLMEAMNEPAEVALRVNPLKLGLEEARERLERSGQPLDHEVGEPLPHGCLVLAGRMNAQTIEMLRGGELVAQSRASQLVARAVAAERGQRALDLCAAPGGKTSALAGAVGPSGEVVAVEIDRARASRLERALELAGCSHARVVCADATEIELDGAFERVLLDPPCSDLGTLDSRPDARWRKTPETIERLSELQSRLLRVASRCVAPGGTVTYSVCTLTSEEGEGVVSDSDLERLDLSHLRPAPEAPAPRGAVVTRRDLHGTTGFTIAALAPEARR